MAGPGLLVNTTFSSGPNDKLAAVDVYKRPGAAVVNSYQDLGAKSGLDVFGALTGTGRGAIGSIILKVNNGKIILNPQAILARMTGGNNPLSAAFRNVSSAVQGGLSIAGNLAQSVFANVSGVVHAVTSTALDDVRGLGSVINAATNNSYGMTIIDNGAMAGMVASVSLEGSRLGMPNVFSTLAGTITDPRILSSAAGMIMPTAVRTGDFALLGDIGTTSIGRQAGLQYPSLVSDMAFNARAPYGMPQNQYPGHYASMKETFNNMDPGWDSYTRESGVVLNAAPVVADRNTFMSQLISSTAYSQGNSDMATAIGNGTSAQENLTDDKVTMCAREAILVDGEPIVTNYIKRSYPLVSQTAAQPPVTTTNDYSSYGPQYIIIDGEAQKTVINGKTYDPSKLYIDGEPVENANFSRKPYDPTKLYIDGEPVENARFSR